MTHFALDDPLLDAQALRVAGSAVYGGADREECLAACARVRGTDLISWYVAWMAAADDAEAIGEHEADEGHAAAASGAFLRASNYARNAGVMLLGLPVDARLPEAQARQTALFRRAASLLARPPQFVEIPYEGTSLPGYFFSAGDGRRETVILTGGYDGTAEELYLFNGVAALERGYNVLAFDGPGQGAALLERGLTMRPDWEAVITPVVDFLVGRDDVEAGQDRADRAQPRRPPRATRRERGAPTRRLYRRLRVVRPLRVVPRARAGRARRAVRPSSTARGRGHAPDPVAPCDGPDGRLGDPPGHARARRRRPHGLRRGPAAVHARGPGR